MTRAGSVYSIECLQTSTATSTSTSAATMTTTTNQTGSSSAQSYRGDQWVLRQRPSVDDFPPPPPSPLCSPPSTCPSSVLPSPTVGGRQRTAVDVVRPALSRSVSFCSRRTMSLTRRESPGAAAAGAAAAVGAVDDDDGENDVVIKFRSGSSGTLASLAASYEPKKRVHFADCAESPKEKTSTSSFNGWFRPPTRLECDDMTSTSFVDLPRSGQLLNSGGGCGGEGGGGSSAGGHEQNGVRFTTFLSGNKASLV